MYWFLIVKNVLNKLDSCYATLSTNSSSSAHKRMNTRGNNKSIVIPKVKNENVKRTFMFHGHQAKCRTVSHHFPSSRDARTLTLTFDYILFYKE